jgi:hypothetical protein
MKIYSARKRQWWRGGFAAAMLAFSSDTQAQVTSPDSRFCVVAARDGQPTPADFGDVWRMTRTNHRIPGLSSLVFTPNNRGGAWIVGNDRRFAAFETPFPRSYLDTDEWVYEPWSGRVIATGYGYRSLYEFVGGDPGGSNVFREIPGSNGPHYSRPYLLPQSREVLVERQQSHHQNSPDRRWPHAVFVVGNDGLVLWQHDELIRKHGIRSPEFHWSDELKAVVIFGTSEGMAKGKTTVHVLKDGSIADVGTLNTYGYGYGHDLKDLSGQQAAILVTATSAARLVSFRTPQGAEKYRLDHLHEQVGNGAGSHFLSSKQHGSVLYVQKSVAPSTGRSGEQPESSFWRWFQWGRAPTRPSENVSWHIQLVERDTLKALNVVIAPEAPPLVDSVPVTMTSFPELGVTLLASKGALYKFDGTELQLLDTSQVKELSRYPIFAGASTIGRLLMATGTGLYEIVGGSVKRLDIPELSGPQFAIRILKDWNAAGVVIVNRENTLYTIDRDLKVQRVATPHTISKGIDFVGEQPGNGDIILNGVNSVLLVVDTARHGHELCKQ